jgi:4-aminobutyrate aminotransferase/(S)-3-amino-2-methylpropionate transaminase
MARLDARDCPAFAMRRSARAAASGQEPSSMIVLARGEGANVWDADDNRYVDLAAGFGSVLLGHGAPAITRALEEQSTTLVQGLGDLYASDVKIALVERLACMHPDPRARVMICQSGADAITAALKTALLATGRAGVLAFEGAYHGLSYAPLAACGFKPSFREPFEAQLGRHVRFIPYPRTKDEAARSLEAARRELARGDVGAVLLEPILGRGGVVVPPDGFLGDLSASARERGALVVADEIWTGLGRSGALSRMRDVGASFDVLCLGKGLGGGVSISAAIASDDVMGAWASGGEVVHTSTHAGSPLACAAALATLDAIEASSLAARSRGVGARFVARLERALGDAPAVSEVRGVGMMIGVELGSAASGLRVQRALLSRGFLSTSGGASGQVVVFTPPLTISEAQLDATVDALLEAVTAERHP